MKKRRGWGYLGFAVASGIAGSLFGTFIAILIFHGMQPGSVPEWISSVFGSTALIAIIYQIWHDKQIKIDESSKDDMEEKWKNILVRPRPVLRYLQKLNEGQSVFYNSDHEVWIKNKGEWDVDNQMFALTFDDNYTFKGRKKIDFITKDRFNPKILGVTNNANHDMYDCIITMIYSSGEETKRLAGNKLPVSVKSLNEEIHVENIEVPLIAPKQEIAIVPYPVLFNKKYYMVTLKIQYTTERNEVLKSLFQSDGGEKEIKDYKNNMENVPQTQALDFAKREQYRKQLKEDTQLKYGANDFVSEEIPDFEPTDDEGPNLSAEVKTTIKP